jgi:hypothetical protein
MPAEIDRSGVILPDSFWRDDMTEQTIAQTAPTFWQKTVGSDCLIAIRLRCGNRENARRKIIILFAEHPPSPQPSWRNPPAGFNAEMK